MNHTRAMQLLLCLAVFPAGCIGSDDGASAPGRPANPELLLDHGGSGNARDAGSLPDDNQSSSAVDPGSLSDESQSGSVFDLESEPDDDDDGLGCASDRGWGSDDDDSDDDDSDDDDSDDDDSDDDDSEGISFSTYKVIARRADKFFSELASEHVVYADPLRAALAAGDPVFVVDVRDPPAFAIGHIPTAVNLPINTLFSRCSLRQLPVDGTTIVVVGKDPHAGAMAAGVLGTLGYNAYPLAYGMIGWNVQTSVAVGSASGPLQKLVGIGGPIVQ